MDSDLLRQVLGLIDEGDDEEARDLLAPSVLREPADRDGAALSARCSLELDDPGAADEAATRGLAAAQGDVDLLRLRAEARLRLRRMSDADADAAAVLSARPEDVTGRACRGAVALFRGDASGARRHFEEARRAAPDSFEALLGCGLAALAAGEPGRAEPLLEEAVVADPIDPRGYAALAILSRKREEAERSLVFTDVGLELSGEPTADLLSIRAAALSLLGRPDEGAEAVAEGADAPLSGWGLVLLSVLTPSLTDPDTARALDESNRGRIGGQ